MRPHLFSCVLAALLLATGCDTAPGPHGEEQMPPEVSALALTPQSAFSDTLDTQGGDVLVPFTVSAAVKGDLESVRYVVEPPLRDLDPVALGVMEATGDRYAATDTLRIPRGAIGRYEVRVFATGADGAVSNQVRGTFDLGAPAFAPEIVEVRLSAGTVTPPAEVRIEVDVEDANGPYNLAPLSLYLPTGDRVQVYDDGTGSDEVAFDGSYAATFEVPAGTPAGAYPFAVQALDRHDLLSRPVIFQISVQ